MSDTWTIGELAAHAARALRDAPSPNGRVRDVPGERLIRWYTTIGLVDPPLTRRGRIARYGRRHLLQLVAVKRMQAAGHSIAHIQATLTGATDHVLEDAAGMTSPPPAPGMPRPSSRAAVEERLERRGRFWAELPGRSLAEEGPAPPDGQAAPPPATAPRAGEGALVLGVRLGDGVRLVFDGARVPSDEDVQAVLAAAGPLLAVLEERELI
ncbi:MAG TPA: MerR family transcriptional regulator [Nonomuraea sp.]|nr:MerR family transcriptional regulator [Nonomuraea sp.]